MTSRLSRAIALAVALLGAACASRPAAAPATPLHDEEDHAARDAAWVDADPASLPAGERAAYFAYLTSSTSGYPPFREALGARRSVLPGEKIEGLDEEVVLRVLRLHEVVRGTDAALEGAARGWLVDRFAFFRDRHARGDNAPRHLEAAGAYTQWLARALPTLTERERQRLAAAAFRSRTDQSFPGLDRLAFGLAVVDEWRAAGHPFVGSGIFDDVVCPPVRGRDGRFTRSGSCTSTSNGFYLWVLEHPGQDALFARALDARDDAALATAFFVALARSSTRGYMDMVHRLDPEKSSFRAAVDVLATNPSDPRLADRASDLWRAYPARRGDAFFLLAARAAWLKRDGSVTWENFWNDFDRRYGAPVDASMFSQMLDRGPSAFVLVPTAWKVLGPRSKRIDVLLAHADAALGDAAQPEAGPQLRALSEIVTRLCGERSAAKDLAKLHAYLAGRVERRPDEAPALSILVRDTAPSGCKARGGR